MKPCKRCEQPYPADAFYRNSRYKDGLDTYCRACRKTITATWRKENRHRVRLYSAQQRRDLGHEAQRNRSGFKGVTDRSYFSPLAQSVQPTYEASITIDGRKVYLGQFDTPAAAAAAYDEAAKEQMRQGGQHRTLNFEDTDPADWTDKRVGPRATRPAPNM